MFHGVIQTPAIPWFWIFRSISCLSVRLSESLHIGFRWLPVPIRHVCSLVWRDSGPSGCGAILSGQLWQVSWVTKSKVQVGTFFPFTAKVDSKSTKITQIILTSSPPTAILFSRVTLLDLLCWVCNVVSGLSHGKKMAVKAATFRQEEWGCLSKDVSWIIFVNDYSLLI